MKLKNVQIFEKYGVELEGNNTEEENDGFVGDYFDVVMES